MVQKILQQMLLRNSIVLIFILSTYVNAQDIRLIGNDTMLVDRVEGVSFCGWYKENNQIAFYNHLQEDSVVVDTSWYKNGAVESLVTRKNKQKQGLYLVFYKEGELKSRAFYSERGAYIYDFYKSGKVSRCVKVSKEGYFNGLMEEWYENGSLKQVVDFSKDFRRVTNYHDNGVKSIEGWSDNGILQGEWLYWDRNGNLIKKEVYKDNELILVQEY